MTTKTQTKRTPVATTTVVARPELISPREYVQDLRTRIDIHNTEFVQFVKDIYAAGVAAHKLVDQAYANVRPVVAPVIARVRN